MGKRMERLRRAAILAAGLSSTIAGMALAWCVIPAEVITATSTPVLIVLASLLLLPLAAFGALTLDRAARKGVAPAPRRVTGPTEDSPASRHR